MLTHLLINVKVLTIVDILAFMSRKIVLKTYLSKSLSKPGKKTEFIDIFQFMSI